MSLTFWAIFFSSILGIFSFFDGSIQKPESTQLPTDIYKTMEVTESSVNEEKIAFYNEKHEEKDRTAITYGNSMITNIHDGDGIGFYVTEEDTSRKAGISFKNNETNRQIIGDIHLFSDGTSIVTVQLANYNEVYMLSCDVSWILSEFYEMIWNEMDMDNQSVSGLIPMIYNGGKPQIEYKYSTTSGLDVLKLKNRDERDKERFIIDPETLEVHQLRTASGMTMDYRQIDIANEPEENVIKNPITFIVSTLIAFALTA